MYRKIKAIFISEYKIRLWHMLVRDEFDKSIKKEGC